MTDDYPTEWGFQPEREELPTINGHPVAALRSGLQRQPEERGDEFPSDWLR